MNAAYDYTLKFMIDSKYRPVHFEIFHKVSLLALNKYSNAKCLTETGWSLSRYKNHITLVSISDTVPTILT